MRKQSVQDSQMVLSVMEMYGFHASKVEIYNANTQEYEILTLSNNETKDTNELNKNDLDELNMVLSNQQQVSTILKIKLTGDVSRIGKHIQVVNIAFTFLMNENLAL